MELSEIYLQHKDWNGLCCLDKSNNKIYRKDIVDNDDYGYVSFLDNKMVIKWNKWNEEIFYINKEKQYIYENIYKNTYDSISILDNENKFVVILNKLNNKFIIWNIPHIIGKYIKNDTNLILYFTNKSIIKKYKKVSDTFYFSESIEKNFYQIELMNNNILTKFIFNRINKEFYNINDISENGYYNINENILNMKWINGIEKKFYTNIFYSFEDLNRNGINIIKPNNIVLNNKVLFSNITLCKNKIILTSIFYKNEKIKTDLLKLDINIKSNKILKRSIYENNHYESSKMMILELEKYEEHLILNINEESIYLQQLYIPEHNISAMTLFKDDYCLLKKYLEYYSILGVTIFFIYYNGKINNTLIDFLNKNISDKYKIYLVEWNYTYWWFINKDEKHHHAQTMAINDSLHILKNYGQYTLYNDLDEYIVMNSEYSDFTHMITENKDIDIFVFKNQFCKIYNDDNLIRYEDFYEKFDLSKIILGNYWDKAREKNLIKLENINIMGVHDYFIHDINIIIKKKDISKFYHIINFEEKNREILMTEYVVN